MKQFVCPHNIKREPGGLIGFQVKLASSYFGELPDTMIKIDNSPQTVWHRFVEGNVKGDCFKPQFFETMLEISDVFRPRWNHRSNRVGECTSFKVIQLQREASRITSSGIRKTAANRERARELALRQLNRSIKRARQMLLMK